MKENEGRCVADYINDEKYPGVVIHVVQDGEGFYLAVEGATEEQLITIKEQFPEVEIYREEDCR